MPNHRSSFSLAAIAGLALVQLSARAQTAAEPAFEVASIKPHPPGDFNGGFSFGHDRVTATNVTLKDLISDAYSVRDHQISGADGWMDSEKYDLFAKAEHEVSGKELWEMVRPLLADRFKLSVRRETRTMTVYKLVVAKGGTKMQRSANDAQYSSRSGRGVYVGQKMKIGLIAEILSGFVQRPVIDQTGLEGEFDFRLEWKSGDPAGESIFTTLPEQLGLKLESGKGPVEILIVTHAEKPSAN